MAGSGAMVLGVLMAVGVVKVVRVMEVVHAKQAGGLVRRWERALGLGWCTATVRCVHLRGGRRAARRGMWWRGA